MRLVDLTSSITINPERVASVTVNPSYDSVTVRMDDGVEHYIDRDYGKNGWTTKERIVRLLLGD